MMGYEASELESMEGEEAVEAPGPAPEPRAPEPRAPEPEPEPGLDLSLSPSPLPESPERRGGSPGRRKGRRGGSRRGRQVRFHLAPASPVRSEPLLASGAPNDDSAAPHELEAPALQSSLALSLELQHARAAVASGQFDASKAVEEQLRKSFQTRCVLEETVAEGGARAGARHDHAVQPRLALLRISALDSGRAAPVKASSPAPPFRRYLSHASDAEALGSVAPTTPRSCQSVLSLKLFHHRIKFLFFFLFFFLNILAPRGKLPIGVNFSSLSTRWQAESHCLSVGLDFPFHFHHLCFG
ncbi:protein phosphatase 1 regulatory subunit 35 isoform X2 [Peromyscus maniculatus bairdii]|uniref:protein phosphatase 1 regulatory subunit 35 isoform X2 n=1 Tax=Peromyscus maniculatus bairdii TaxID=230844 RepID=UPI003FD4EB53